MAEGNDDYEVGYGKPPKHSRFQKGKSGNPSGRPKKRKTIDDLVAEEAGRRITVTENGKRTKRSAERLTVRKAIKDGLTGTPRDTLASLQVMKNANAARHARGGAGDPGDREASDRAAFEAFAQFQAMMASGQGDDR
jgi:hypothetical protein